MRKIRVALLVSIVSGGGLALCQAPYRLGWVSFVCLVPWLLQAEERLRRGAGWKEATLAGFLLGVVHYGALLYWIAFLPPEEMTIPALGLPAAVVLVLYLSLFDILFALLLHAFRVRGRLPLWLAAPVAWTGAEWVRGSGVLAFSWGSLGYALSECPAAIQGAAVVGVLGLSAWIVLANVLLVELGQRAGRWRPPPRQALAVFVPRTLAFWLLLWIPLAGGVIVLRTARPSLEGLRIALVQLNIGGDAKWRPDYREWNLSRLEEMTRDAARYEPEVIIWPETAATAYLRYDRKYAERVEQVVNAAGRPLVAGFLDAEPRKNGGWRTFNAAGLFLPARGLTATYRKMHLVPFGEVLPLSAIIPGLDKVDLGEADFTPGTDPVLLSWEKARSGVLICFESIFQGMSRTLVRRGANLLVNITNDSWFGDSAAPHQHASMAVVRAVEMRRALARCANTGVSLLVDPWGRITLHGGVFRPEILVGSLPLEERVTFYARWGGVLDAAHPVAALILLIGSFFFPRLPRGGRRRREAVGGVFEPAMDSPADSRPGAASRRAGRHVPLIRAK